jgi:hypothetical protein
MGNRGQIADIENLKAGEGVRNLPRYRSLTLKNG